MNDSDGGLDRFVQAQQAVYTTARDELLAGRKESHWMWFIFPQLRGLGHSTMATRYGIASLAEAQAYLQHPVLGARLRECTGIMLATPEKSARDILGAIDELKFCSCMTLFAQAGPGEPMFSQALHRFYPGHPDKRTLDLLAALKKLARRGDAR